MEITARIGGGESGEEKYRRGFRFLVVHGHGRAQIQLF